MRWSKSNGPFEWQPSTVTKIWEEIPEDSISWRRPDSHDLTQTLVWICDGDLILDFLDLEYGSEAEPVLLLIRGNLTVTGGIYNENTDGAISLLVLGNLTAGHMAVGGQEIYVAGNLTVPGLFCGSYNHGDLLVKGNAAAAVWLVEDEYHYIVHGLQQVGYLFEDPGALPKTIGFPLFLEEILVKEAFIETDDGEGREFYFGCLKAVLERSSSPLNDLNALVNSKIRAIFGYFADDTLDETNMAKLTGCILMDEEDASFRFTVQGVDFFVKRARLNSEGEPEADQLLIETEKAKYFLLADADEWQLLAKNLLESGADWQSIDDESEEFKDFWLHWRNLLHCVSIAEYYSRRISPDYIERLFTMEAILELDPEDEDNDGFWNGDFFYRFNRCEDGSFPEVDIQAPDEVRYFFEVDGARVIRYYRLSDDQPRQRIGWDELAQWERSEQCFAVFQKFMERRAQEEEAQTEAELTWDEVVDSAEDQKDWEPVDAIFQRISQREARWILKEHGIADLTIDPEGQIYVAQGEVVLTEFIVGELHEDVTLYLFMSNLTVSNYLVSADLDYSPAVVVLGDCTARCLSLSGNGYYFCGKLTVDELLYGKYNHGFLAVRGPADLNRVVADDFRMHFEHEDFSAGALTGNHVYWQGQLQPAIHNAEDILAPEMLTAENHLEGHCFCDDGAIYQGMVAGRCFWLEPVSYSVVPQQIGQLFESEKFKQQSFIELKVRGVRYRFNKNATSAQTTYCRQIQVDYYQGYAFRFEYQPEEGKLTADYLKYDSNGEVESETPCSWEMGETIYDAASLRALYNAIQVFNLPPNEEELP